MPYIKKRYKFGNRIEIEKVHSGRYGKKGKKHNPKTNPTPEDVAKVNERNQIKKLRRTMQASFEFGSQHVVLTYKKESRPDKEEAHKILKKFLGEMRKEYRKNNSELKYIVTTEYKGKAIHHHIVINELDDTSQCTCSKIVRRVWKHGGTYFSPLWENGEYGDLAAYFVKETKETCKDKDNPCKQAYSCSRNLIKPEPEIEIVQADTWMEIPVAEKGYWIDKGSISNGVSAITGYGYQYYTMILYDSTRDDMSEEKRDHWILPKVRRKR